jgi:hypothetical protein
MGDIGTGGEVERDREEVLQYYFLFPQRQIFGGPSKDERFYLTGAMTPCCAAFVDNRKVNTLAYSWDVMGCRGRASA